jgi:phosphotransferase system enzyme I (PtsI)
VGDSGAKGGPIGPLFGIAGSPGVAIATALVIETGAGRVPRRTIASEDKKIEIERFLEAVTEAQEQVAEVHARVAAKLPAEQMKILEAYLAMLADPTLADAVRREINDKNRNAEWAVEVAIFELMRAFDAADDPYIKERRHDVEFVGDRLQRALASLHPSVRALSASPDRRRRGSLTMPINAPTIVIAHDLSPADTAAMAHERIEGFVTEVGTRTSHTSIVARALEIPAVVGVNGVLEHVRTGDLIIVDGLRGEVFINPTDEHAIRAKARATRHLDRARELRSRSNELAMLACGQRVRLSANVELFGEAQLALDHGAEGIGLYRTEFLYIGRKDLPSEDDQYDHYRAIIELMGDRPVTLRTFDLGGDKLATSVNILHEANPALGVRAVRLALRMPDIFLTQLRAIARAASSGNVRVMIPMVSTIAEFRSVRALVTRALRELDQEGSPHGAIELGVMIEVPSAAICADIFAREAAFFSIGTNDLVQYTIATDRASHGLAQLASHFDPSVLRLIRNTINAANDQAIPVSVCGAMASDPLSALLLVGMGVRELSMEAAAIGEIKEALRRVTLTECEHVAADCVRLHLASEVELTVAEAFAPRLSDLLAADDSYSLLPPPVTWD